MEKKNQIEQLLKDRILILDGATGTEMQKRGLPTGVSPELWSIDNPNVSSEIYNAYLNAGSDILYTCTFGANPWKLEDFGAESRTEEINKKITETAVKVADKFASTTGKKTLIAGDIGPSGKFIMPFGDLDFEEAVKGFKRQVKGLYDGGVDIFVIETQIDIQECRAALLAVKEITNGFTMVSMTFDESGRSLNGTSPEAMAITMQSLGADVVGVNCSTGPADMLNIVKRIKAVTDIPVMAKPNAGMPEIKNGETIFPMNPQEFSSYADAFAKAGVNIMGGCCGTTPEHIDLLSKKLANKKPKKTVITKKTMLSSAREILIADSTRPIKIIGERINPTGKKTLQAELKKGNMNYVRKLAKEQSNSGADLLDINAGMPGIDEKQTMLNIISALSPVVGLPLVIDSSDPDVIEACVRYYPGRALINSISAERQKISKLLPIAAHYGAAFVALPITDNELPKTAERRKLLVKTIAKEAESLGYKKQDIIVDGLVMTVSSDPLAAQETLETVRWANSEGFGTVLGLSNISFGLPKRAWINSTFLAMAAGAGLSWAIANPSDELLTNIKSAADVLTARDIDATTYIKKFTSDSNNEKNEHEKVEAKKNEKIEDKIVSAIIEGRREEIELLCKKALKEKIAPSSLLQKWMIPAIMKVGDFYDSRKYFLPQLIASAETMQRGFNILEPALKSSGTNKSRGTIVFATVQGDIHDIGKNIVVLMLRNFGFKVIDLGKDVTAKTIVDAAIENNADVVGLSALMTTTMIRMPEIMELAKKKGLGAKFMVGGAVVTREWAKSIGAEYSTDGVEAVSLASKLCKA